MDADCISLRPFLYTHRHDDDPSMTMYKNSACVLVERCVVRFGCVSMGGFVRACVYGRRLNESKVIGSLLVVCLMSIGS